ncbi:CB1 cannabinoid receptor-interacting protein 1-like [Procambarus clarkii]|uniref:CB1 cannabinoid receptor-interacting protein 1-like n=1 Tax=Procambarus clarkii TaxID=6728 RepID=UPI003741EE29
MDCDTNFKVTMSIKKESDGVPVFFKVDGNRFKKERTVKLMVDTPYRVDFSFKPTQTMTRAVIQGEEVDAMERVYDSTASAYSSRLLTDGTVPSPKGHREDLPFIVQLKGGLVMQMSLQVKYYKFGDSQHCDWGSTFHCVEYECETHADAGIVAVLKETFR